MFVMKNILAVDYGKKRMGLAWLQPGIDVVLPYGLIEGNTDAARLKELAQLIKEESLTDIVFGLPLGEDGKENENTERVRAFAADVKKSAKVNIEFVDERHSSRAADQMEGDASRDEKAAMVILNSYIGQVGV